MNSISDVEEPEKTSEGRRAVTPSLNGVNYQIPRGVECVVSLPVLEILRNALVPEVERHEDGSWEVRTVPRYPISDMGPVRASEVQPKAEADAAA